MHKMLDIELKPFWTGIIIFLIFVVLNSYIKRIQISQEVYMDAMDEIVLILMNATALHFLVWMSAAHVFNGRIGWILKKSSMAQKRLRDPAGAFITMILIGLINFLKRIQTRQGMDTDEIELCLNISNVFYIAIWMAENYVYHPGVFAGMFAAGMASVGMTLCDVFIQILIN